MNSTFVWILMSAGALVAVLGAILVTSERELKAKRRQIEELLTKLESSAQGAGAAAPLEPLPDQSAQLAELQAQNRELQNQLQALSGKLASSQRTIEELEAARENNAVHPAETERLRLTNDQLQAQLNELRGRLAAGQTSQTQDSQEKHALLQSEVAELRQELEVRQAKIRELEAAQQNIPNVAAIEAGHRQERQGLQERIAELERRLLADQDMLAEAQALRQRLAEAEESQKSLREEIRRQEEEIPRWQARIAEGEENRRRLTALQAPYDALLSKQAALADRQRQLQEDLSAFARLMATPVDTTQPANSPSGSPGQGTPNAAATASEAIPKQVVSANFATSNDRDAADPHALEPNAPQSAAPEPAAATGRPEPKRARSYGIFGILILLAAAGAVGFQFLGSNSAQAPAAFETANVTETTSPTTSTTPEQQRDAAEAPAGKLALAKPAVNEGTEIIPRARETAKPEPRVAGTFQVTRPSRVYAAPNEYSQSLGDIEPGVKVNVVDSRDGWLEIHSKHGRPPGFIRREVAARLSSQN